MCFTNGQYIGCVLALTAGVEHGLREFLKKPKSTNLSQLIKRGIDDDVLTERQAAILRAVKDYRNNAAHSNIDCLADGTRLFRQEVKITEKGMTVGSEWKEVEPQLHHYNEIAAALFAEQKVGELMLQVREVMHDLFEGYTTPTEVNSPLSG